MENPGLCQRELWNLTQNQPQGPWVKICRRYHTWKITAFIGIGKGWAWPSLAPKQVDRKVNLMMFFNFHFTSLDRVPIPYLRKFGIRFEYLP